jgi:DNA-binding CsgD family transcriptional regulator
MTHTIVAITKHFVPKVDKTESPKFSQRENEIISYLIRRLSYKEIAAVLDISHNTVRNHIQNICHKTGCSSKSGIIDHILKTDIDLVMPTKSNIDDFVFLNKNNYSKGKFILIALSLIIMIIGIFVYNEFLL